MASPMGVSMHYNTTNQKQLKKAAVRKMACRLIEIVKKTLKQNVRRATVIEFLKTTRKISWEH